jgi:hypothetical protein
MDMNSRMAMAEKLSVAQLQQAIQSGSLPAYIGIPLIEQKNKERAQMAAAQQGQQKPPSVVSQILQQSDAQEQQERGIDELPSNLPMMEDEEMGMAGGGIVAFADEGQVVDPNAPPVPAVPPAAMSKYGGIESISPEGRAKFAEYEGLLKDLRGKGGSEREQAKAMAIFQAGLGMMGGTSPNAFANIAAGAMPAVTQYQSALKDIRKEDRDTLKQMLDLGVTKEQFLQKAQQMGIDVYKADKAYDATMGAAKMRAAAEKQPRAVTTAELDQQEVARAAALLKEQNPGMTQAQAESQAYREILRIRNPDPSNLTGIAPILIAKNNYVLNAKKPAQEALATAMRTGDPKRIEDAKTALKTAEATANAQFDAYFSGIGAQSNLFNRPPAGANPPPASANPPANPPPTGAGAAPKIPPGATPNADGTFNFPGNAKVPKGTYKMNPDGTITRVK